MVTGAGETHEAPAVILATGSAYKELGLPEEKKFSGHGVSWCATCDGFFFRDQDIIVVGGGDSAMEEATFLTRFGKSVTVVVRKGELRASRIMAQRAKDNPKIRFAWNSAITAIHGDAKVTGVTLKDTRTGETREQAATGIFVAIGHVPRTELVAGQVDLDAEGYIKVDSPPPSPTFPASSPAATPWTTATARPSPPRAPAAPPRWTPNATWPRWTTPTASPPPWWKNPPTPDHSGGDAGVGRTG